MLKRKILSVFLAVVFTVSLLAVLAVPSGAYTGVTIKGNGEERFDDVRTAWCYAVYMSKRTGKEVLFKLNEDFNALTDKGKMTVGSNQYKYNKFDFGVNVRERDIRVSDSDNFINAYRYGSLLIPSGAKIVLDLNGYTLNRKMSKQIDDGEVIHVEPGGTLTVRNSREWSGGITGGKSKDGAGGIHVRGTLIFQSGKIFDCETNEHGGAIFLTDSGTVRMTGGSIVNCQTRDSGDDCNGGAVYVKSGTCRLSNCRIESCKSEDKGGAVYQKGGTLYCENVRFDGNYAKDEGGAVYLYEGNSSFTNCIFSGNSTKGSSSGGAVYVNTSSKYRSVFTDCSILSNWGGAGAGMNVDDGQVDLIRCWFYDNYSNRDGGALYVNTDDGVNIIECEFTHNQSEDEGGAVFVNDDRVVFSGVVMTSNRAVNHGGAIYVDADYDLNIQGYCRILNNRSDKKHTANVALQETSSGNAYLYAGSLEEGSCIHIASTGSGEEKLTKSNNLSQYQYAHYFVTDGSTSKLINLKERSSPFITSVFSKSWSAALFCIGVAAVLGGAVCCIVIRKKKKGGASHD